MPIARGLRLRVTPAAALLGDPDPKPKQGREELLQRGRTVLLVLPIEDAQFHSVLEQVRELHRLAYEVTRESARIHTNVRARLGWGRDVPHLPPEQRKVADEAVEAQSKSRLSSSQSRQLHRAFFVE